MKTKNFVRVVVVLLLGLSLSCTSIKNKTKDKDAIGVSLNNVDVVMFDPKAPLVSPGAEAVRRLAQLDPRAAVFVPDIEAVESTVMKKAIDEGLNENKSAKATEGKSPLSLAKGPATASPFTPVKYEPAKSSFGAIMFQGSLPNAAERTHSAALIGGLIAGMKQIFSESHTSEQSSGAVKGTRTETKDGTTTTMGVELSFNDDGSSGFGLNLKTEAVKDGARVVAQMEGKVEGFDCPNAEGQVPLTVKLRIWSESGGFGYTQDLTAFIRATVDDNADLVTTTVDLVQGTREVSNGKEFYVETGLTVQLDNKNTENFSESNWRLVRHSQGATAETARPAAESGQNSALAMALTVLKMAEQKWQNGGCVRIDAKSPGNVAVNSTTQIPVKVIHKFGGTEVPSKLEAALSGGASVAPNLIPRTSGTLTYIAPGETGRNATIKLKAVSKRGRATLDLTAGTGGQSYRVAGVSNGVSFTGEICNVNKPFTIDAKFPAGTAKTSFSPSSAGGGSTRVSGGGGGCVQTGGGTYTITTNPDGTATISWTTTDQLTCPGFNNSRTATFTLPLQPAPEIACP
jgi:hypothetical protein